MAQPKHRFWRVFRVCFRRFRIAVWFLVFLVISALVYVNQVGLPDFVKRPLLDRLRQRGLNLQFSRMRIRWYEGIVADDVRFARADEPSGPELTLREIQVLLNWRALTHLQLQVDSLGLRKGRLVWPILSTNQSPREFSVDNIETRLRFLPDDQWELDRFTASFAGVRIQLSGMITNASAVRQWSFVQEKQPSKESATAWQSRLRRFAETLETIHFASPPELSIAVQGDARDLQSFGVRVMIAAPNAATPWGEIAGGKVNARVYPASTNGLSRADLAIEAAHATSQWAELTNFVMHLNLVSSREQTNLVTGDLTLSAKGAKTEWASGDRVNLTAHWVHSLTNPVPISGRGRLRCGAARTQWGTAEAVVLAAELNASSNVLHSAPDPSWGWWTNLQPYALQAGLHLGKVQTPDLQTEDVNCQASWQAPVLSVSNLDVRLLGGRLGARAQLDVGTRALRLGLTSSFDPHGLGPMLPEEGRRWLGQFAWSQPPEIQGELSLVLPAWTNRQPDWRAEVLPTLSLSGQFNLPRGGGYQNKIQVTTAGSHFLYSNMTLHLPDLRLATANGGLLAEHRVDERTKEFYWRVHSTVNPASAQPFLDAEQRKGLDLFVFTQPPVMDVELWGRYAEPARIGLRGRLAVTNFSFRGEAFSGLQTSFQFSNQLFQVFSPRLQVGAHQASADGLAVDLGAQLIFLTNGVSSVEPGLVARAIGPHIARIIEPYHFLEPPSARVYGTIPMRGEANADLHFELEGGPFEWWKFKLPHVAANVHWMGQHLTLEDIRAGFYGGQAAGLARFDFSPKVGNDFEFAFGFTNVQLHALMSDLATRTNHLEGLLHGAISVTKANTDDWRTVHGYGELTLRDGLLWDLPLLGVFSPILNAVSPGLGNSRASAATCGFVITNGFIFSNDLEIRSTAMRLKYYGTVDLVSRVNARVEAELLRDMWAVGPFVSAIFWPVSKLFEYKVTNTLDDPKTEPMFLLPKLVLFPFHPLRALKNLLPEDSATRTNSPSPPK